MIKGILRIRQAGSKPVLIGMRSDGHKGKSEETEGSFDTYLGRLVKLIPAEVISLYLVGKGTLTGTSPIAWVIWTIVCFCGVILVRSIATSEGEGEFSPQWGAVTISAISFLVWVYSMGDVFTTYQIHQPQIASLAVLTWTFFVPYFYRGSTDYSQAK